MDATDPPRHAAAVLLVRAAGGVGGGAVPAGLEELASAGVVPVAADEPLAGPVADLPSGVGIVAVWDGTADADADADADARVGDLAQMLRALDGGADACVRARPVTDAVKIVDGDRVVGSVDRATLTYVGLPVVVHRDALGGGAGEVAAADAATLTRRLLEDGRRVRVVGAAAGRQSGGRS